MGDGIFLFSMDNSGSKLLFIFYRVVDTTLYLSDTSVHLFLQTKLSCDQIDQYLKGKLPDSVKELAERECDLEADRYGMLYSKTCVKRPLKNRQNKDLNDKW